MENKVEAKFMANLLRKPMDHTRYMSFLKYVTPDPQIPNRRIIFGIVGMTLVIVVTILTTLSLSGSLLYIFPGILALFLGGTIFVILYMVPMRSESILGVLSSLFFVRIAERFRMKNTTNAALTSMGIKKLSKEGLMLLDSGYYARFYRIEGQLSNSTLPSVVSHVNNLRRHHLIGRTTFSQEKTVTMISRIDLSELLEYYREIYQKNSQGNVTLEMEVRRELAQIHYKYVNDQIHLKKTDVRQYMMIIDIDRMALDKTVASFESSVNSGMLASARRLSGPEIDLTFKPMALVNPKES